MKIINFKYKIDSKNITLTFKLFVIEYLLRKKLNSKIYLKVIKRLKVSKRDCLIVEDSIEGIESKNASGIETLNIVDENFKDNQKEISSRANYILNNMDEFLKVIKGI